MNHTFGGSFLIYHPILMATKLRINNCINTIPINDFYKNKHEPNNLCLNEDILGLSSKYNNICRCDNGLLGVTDTGDKKDCNCNGTQNNSFTYFDNYKGDHIIFYTRFLFYMIFIFFTILFLVYNKNKNIEAISFFVLVIYLLYLLYRYYKLNMIL